VPRAHSPQRVGTNQGHSVACRNGCRFLTLGRAFRPHFLEAGGDDDAGLHSASAAVFHHVCYRGARHCYEYQIHRLRKLRYRGVRLLAVHAIGAGVYWIDPALVAARQQAGKNESPPLGGVVGSAHNSHAAGVEERPKVGRICRVPSSPRLLLAAAQSYQSVYGHRYTLPVDQQRVDIDLEDLGVIERHLPDGAHRLDKSITIDGRRTSEGAQQLFGSNLIQHAPGVSFPQRRDAEGDVLDGFCEDSSHAEHDDWAKLRIVGHAYNELATRRDHLLN